MMGAWGRAGIRVLYGLFLAALIGGLATPIITEWNAPDAAATSWMETAATPENIALAVIFSVIVGLIARAVTQGGGY